MYVALFFVQILNHQYNNNTIVHIPDVEDEHDDDHMNHHLVLVILLAALCC